MLCGFSTLSQTFECANVCQRDKTNCHVYGIKDKECYIGNPESAAGGSVISSATEDLRMWMTIGTLLFYFIRVGVEIRI